MTNRTKRGQKVHDETVAKLAESLKASGKTVLADLPGHKKPSKIGGKIPDIVVKRQSKTELIVEVETPSSVKKDKKQQDTFKNAAKSLGAKYKLIIAKEKRSR